MNIKASFFMLATCALAVGCDAQVSNPTNVNERIELQCGGYRAVIKCGHIKISDKDESPKCNNNTLHFFDPGGKERLAKTPPLTKIFHDDNRPIVLEDTSPQGMSCNRQGKKLFVLVEYSRGVRTREIFFDWFEPNGKRLTSLGVSLQKNFKDPNDGIPWDQQPKLIYIERESK